MANGEGSRLRRKLPLTHKRSLSNPLSNTVLNQEVKDKTPSPDHTHNSTQGGTSRSSLACYSYRSPSPPSRSGSQPSILSNVTETEAASSPQPCGGGRNLPLRRVSNITPAFSQSISNDQLIPTISSSETMSGSESLLCRHKTWQGLDDGLATTQRCNSMAGMSPHNYSHHQMQNGHSLDMTSSSMVDLPVGLYNGHSNEHLDMEREGGNLPHSSAKSQSVPRLTLMSVSMDTERGECWWVMGAWHSLN